MLARLALALPCVLLAACSSSSPHVVTPATSQQTSDLLDRVKSLDGEWTCINPESKQPVLGAVIKTSSNGSIVRQIMFPGSAEEMTNIYHMDGPSLLVTHYCAMGNQPRMRATHAEGNTLHFESDGVTNLTSAAGSYMGELTIVFLDKDHFTEKWRTLQDGKLTDHTEIAYTRKK